MYIIYYVYLYYVYLILCISFVSFQTLTIPPALLPKTEPEVKDIIDVVGGSPTSIH